MLRVALIGLFVTFVITSLRAQSLEVPRSIGVEVYRPVQPSVYRLLVGGGVNGGLFDAAPITEFAAASLRRNTDLFGVSVIVDRSTTTVPRRTFAEYDILYGYAYELQIARQGNPPDFYHFAASIGLGLDTYSVRWRQSRRRAGDLLSPHPNTFDYAVGFPVQLQAVFEPAKYVGAGLFGYANFNSISANYGLAIAIEARL